MAEKLPFANVEQASVVEALRGIGLLDELVETSEGLVVYSKEMHVKKGE